MFEDKNEENIHQDLLKNIDDGYEKTVGYPVYDLTKAYSVEQAETYKDLDKILSKLDVNNLSGAELEKFIYQRTGITKKLGDYANTLLTVNGNGIVTAGDKFQTKSNIQYACIQDTSINGTGNVPIQALQIGTYGNTPANTITQIPVTIVGIASCTNLEPVDNGYDEESDESLRRRYFERLRTPATSGNKAQYKNWAKEVPGVGDAKVTPLWNGNGTVKVVIINANKKAADSELVQKVKDYIDPEPEGKGEGQAPIGAICTVVSAAEKAMNITATVVLANGYTLQQAQDNFNEAIQKYLSDLAFNSTYISYAKVGGILLSTDGIVDYDSDSLTLNNGASNIALADEEIPVVGTINLGV